MAKVKVCIKCGKHARENTLLVGADNELLCSKCYRIEYPDEDYLAGEVQNDEIVPNCHICEWCGAVGYQVIGFRTVCNAQAGKPAEAVYDNENCRKLYKPEQEEK